jgi:hypothetical protein
VNASQFLPGFAASRLPYSVKIKSVLFALLCLMLGVYSYEKQSIVIYHFQEACEIGA